MQKIDKEHIIERIKKVATGLGLTAYEFAKHIPMSEVGIAKILNGKVKNPNITSIEAMVYFLNEKYHIGSDWLLYGKGLMKEVSVPKQGSFATLIESQKKKKLDEIAVFVACHEEELMENSILRSIIERRGYEMIIKKLRSTSES